MNENAKPGVVFNSSQIEAMMPHRYPMLLVDKIVEMEPGKRIVGIKNVTMNEWFFPGHFPGHPIMPGVLIVEAMAQCGGVMIISGVENPKSKVFYFMGIDACRFRKPVVPGDTLKLVLEIDKLKGKIARMKGQAWVDGELVCEADLMSMIVDK